MTKKRILKAAREKPYATYKEKNSWSDNGFLIRNHGGQK